jgi:transcriptional regulator with XRE-family HTH domain
MRHLDHISRTGTGFAAWLAGAMLRERMTMTALGDALGHGRGLHPSSRYKRVTRWLHGHQMPSRAEAEALAIRFGTTLEATGWIVPTGGNPTVAPMETKPLMRRDGGRKKMRRLHEPGYFAANMTALLTAKGQSQSWLAARAGKGCYQTQISQYALGKDVPVPHRAHLIATALGSNIPEMRATEPVTLVARLFPQQPSKVTNPAPTSKPVSGANNDEMFRRMFPDAAAGPFNTVVVGATAETITLRIRTEDFVRAVQTLQQAGITAST